MPLDQHPTPRKKPRKSKNGRCNNTQSLEERLNAYPNLRQKMIEVLDAADNQGGIREADAAEEMIVGLMRDLGGLTFQTWADSQNTLLAEEFADAHPDAENKGKKNFIG